MAGSARDAADPGGHGQATHDHRDRAARPRTRSEKAAATEGFVRDVVPLLADGRLAPVVETVLPLDRVADAYDLVASDATFGKVILDCRRSRVTGYEKVIGGSTRRAGPSSR